LKELTSQKSVEVVCSVCDKKLFWGHFLQHVCRSATISGGAEMYGRRMMDILSGTDNHMTSSASADRLANSDRLAVGLGCHE